MLSSEDCADIGHLPDLIFQVAAFSTYNLKKIKRIVELRLSPYDYMAELNVINKIILIYFRLVVFLVG